MNMHVVTVEFQIQPESLDEFRVAILQQAKNSLAFEKHCVCFDVCERPGDRQFFLYEVYSSKEAFSRHLASKHFKEFDETVTPWIIDKKVTEYELLGTDYE